MTTLVAKEHFKIASMLECWVHILGSIHAYKTGSKLLRPKRILYPKIGFLEDVRYLI